MKKRKLMSFALSICVVVLAFSAVAVPASADANIAKKRVLIMSGPYRDGINSCNAESLGVAFFEWDCLCSLNSTVYQSSVEIYENDYYTGSNDAFLDKISSSFQGADSNDVNYLYINCHGDSNGDLCVNGRENNRPRISLSTLKQSLDNIPGRFVIMFDVCHSGLAISRDASSSFSENSDGYSQMLLNQFLGGDTRSGEFAGSQKYTVFCSSYSNQESLGMGNQEGFATLAWICCLGFRPYSSINGFPLNTPWYGADANRDQIITGQQFGETSAEYLEEFIDNHNTYFNENRSQDICFYRHNKMTTAFFGKYPLGDINRDYSVNMSDVLKLRQYLAEAITLDSEQLKLADTNQSGSVNLQDLLELEKYLAEIAT